MYNTSFIKKILLVATVVFLYSCDKDFNEIGSDLIADDHFGLESTKYDVIAYNQEITAIQSNALSSNALGIYVNPVFGTTTANYTTQLVLTSYAPTIGEEPEIESVVLSVPYFSHVTSVNSDGSSVYALDSIYGPKEGKLKLSVYESGIQMRSTAVSGGSEIAQLYYTDQDSNTTAGELNFDTKKVGDRLNNSENVFENDQFFFDAKQRIDSTKDATTDKWTVTRSSPEMRLNLNKDFFLNRILKAPASKLAAADVFQEYFRGLYFKVEKATDGSASNLAKFDFTKGKITITYKAKTAITTDAETEKEEKTLVLNMSTSITGGVNTASFLQDLKQPIYENAIKAFNKTSGDERLYIKGGEGSLAVIKLTDFASQLEQIRTNKWLVNEANLVFYIDTDGMAPVDAKEEPKRVYLYDLKNNLPIVDYYSDQTSSATTDPKDAKYIFGGLITRGDNKRGKLYKIRITDHIRNLIKNTSAENVDLGLVVSESINVNASNFLKTKNENISQAPRASVMNPLGTILFGNNIPAGNANYDKRLRLEIYYTKPN